MSSNRWLEIGKQVVATTTAAATVDFAIVVHYIELLVFLYVCVCGSTSPLRQSGEMLHGLGSFHRSRYRYISALCTKENINELRPP